MKKNYTNTISLLLLIFLNNYLFSQCAPSLGTSDFDTGTAGNYFGAALPNTATATEDCWDFTVNSATTVTINLVAGGGPTPGGLGDQVIQLTRSGTAASLTSGIFKSNNGSEFKLNSVYIRPNAAAATDIVINGYRDNVLVSGATLTETGINNNDWRLFDVSSNADFNNIDEVRITQSGSIELAVFSIDEINISAASTLKVEEPLSQDVLSLYPNPVKDILNISPINIKIQEATLYNVLGKIVKIFELKNNRVDVSEISTGVYLLILTTDRGTVVKRFIKN